jgi:hypothetical protein
MSITANLTGKSAATYKSRGENGLKQVTCCHVVAVNLWKRSMSITPTWQGAVSSNNQEEDRKGLLHTLPVVTNCELVEAQHVHHTNLQKGV